MVQFATEVEDNLFNKVPSPVYRVTLTDGQFVLVDSNSAGLLFTSGKITSLYDRKIDEIWSSSENRHIADDIKRAHQENRSIDSAFWHQFVSDGITRYIRITYVPAGVHNVLLFVYDLTSEHLAIQQNADDNAKFDALFERSVIGLLEARLDCFLDCNPQMCRLTGYTKQELLGKSMEQLIHHDDLPQALSTIAELDDNPFAVVKWTGRSWRKDGSYFWSENHVTGVVDKAGKLQHHIASVRDISDMVLAEEKLKSALLGTIKAIAATSEARDPYTAGHMERVAEFAVAIADAMQMEPMAIEGLQLGSLIHDIGKIGIPIDILNKPGKLSAHEFDLIKDHSQIGYDILKDIEFPWPIREMVLQHHERLDGSGYPNKLTSDKILLESKIIAVADVLEAVTTHRPYRAAHDRSRALEILREEKGRLDPDIVDCCLALVQQGKIALR
ncbi:MAG: HD domain-containing phosphohydrolase [Pseudohongiellaceae bacterium]